MIEVQSRGATVLGLTDTAHEEALSKHADAIITVPETHPLLMPSLAVVPMRCSPITWPLARGCDIDKPRNLAKSVTVE